MLRLDPSVFLSFSVFFELVGVNLVLSVLRFVNRALSVRNKKLNILVPEQKWQVVKSFLTNVGRRDSMKLDYSK